VTPLFSEFARLVIVVFFSVTDGCVLSRLSRDEMIRILQKKDM